MWYWIFRTLNIAILRTLFKIKVEGLENLPKKTNFIIIANHTSYLDPLVMMIVIPRKIHCIALRSLYMFPLLGWYLQMNEALPEGSSSEKALNLLSKNRVVGLFPEGGISRDGQLKNFRRGVALLALRTGRPIVPCAIFGTYEALPRTARFPKLFTPIKVKIGEPQYLLKEFDDLIDDVYLQEGTFKLQNKIKEMMYAG